MHIFLPLQINASDADVALNGAVTYSIIPDAEDRHKDFFIDPTNGSLYTANKLDREMINRYSLLIKATDNAPLGQKR